MGNIVLTGFMGVGKTTVGKKIAQRLGMLFVDMDEVIEHREGLAIVDIFDAKGEKYFREKEAALFRELLAKENMVISTGGGTFENADLRREAKERAVSVCLVCSLETIMSRIEQLRATRPLLQKKTPEQIRELFKIRAACYIDCKVCVDTDGLSPEQVADRVFEELESKFPEMKQD